MLEKEFYPKMYNQDNITKAWFFASRVHKEQFYPGEKLPYITHIGNVMMEVMAVSSQLENPELAIICAILHDTIEDTPTYILEVREKKSLSGRSSDYLGVFA